jgi:serine/threonine protein kinase
MDDDTLPSFPTYAELTQTKAWANTPMPIAKSITEPAPLDDGRYTEKAVLGVGGMGKVLLVRDGRIGREVAVKMLRDEQYLTADEKARFVREAQVQGQLEHPAIVPVYDIDQRPDGSTFFTMRRVMGRTLHAIIEDLQQGVPEAKARYTRRELLQAFATVCLAIDYAHARGVVHRDLKPANIMLGDFGEVYVLDWGVARIVQLDVKHQVSRLSRPGSMLGTPLYMAPEQMADPDVGPTADVFALGAILFELLTLQRLREPKTLYQPVEARPSVRTPELAIDAELEAICVTATEMLARKRYQSARALQEAIARYLDIDRQTEQRRTLAAAHAARAREALHDEGSSDYEKNRGIAMRELVRALALEPTHPEYVAMLAEIMSKPPPVVPAEVRAQIQEEEQQHLRTGFKHSFVSIASWFAFFPFVLLAGVLRFDYLLAIAIPVGLTCAFTFLGVRQQPISRRYQVASTITLMCACMALSRIFGPMMIGPAMIAAWAIAVQTHPDRTMRVFSLVAAGISTVLPIALEAIGVLPSSYAFTDEGLVVLPQMMALPKSVTLVFLTIASLGIYILPALMVARLRTDMTAMERRHLTQMWHFRRLGDDLIKATDRV